MNGSEIAGYMLRDGAVTKSNSQQANDDLPPTPESQQQIQPSQTNNDLHGYYSENNQEYIQEDEECKQNGEYLTINNSSIEIENHLITGQYSSVTNEQDISIIIADDEVFKQQRMNKYMPKGVRPLSQLKKDIKLVCGDNKIDMENSIEEDENINTSQISEEDRDNRLQLFIGHKLSSSKKKKTSKIKRPEFSIIDDSNILIQKDNNLSRAVPIQIPDSPQYSRNHGLLKQASSLQARSRTSKQSKYSVKLRLKERNSAMDTTKPDESIRIETIDEQSLFQVTPRKSRHSKNDQRKLNKKKSTSEVVSPKIKKPKKQIEITVEAKDQKLMPQLKVKTVPRTFESEEEYILFQKQILNNQSRDLVGQDLNAHKQDFKERPLVINVVYTQYEVMADVAKETNMKLSMDEEEDWDVWWIDGMIMPTLIHKMNNYQRVNHLPSVQVLARKNLLAKNLNYMAKAMPELYDFFPQTWILPSDAKSFKDQFNGKRAKTFIVKPDFQCQGLGIFLTRHFEWIQQGEHYVAQKYLHKPYLIDKLKFDLRIYILVTGVAPLRCYIFKEGLARFATEQYQSPLGPNLNNLCMHLTNYAINKEQPEFQQNENIKRDDIGHKRSLTSIFKHIDRNRTEENGLPSGDDIWQQIKEICVKTLFSGIHSVEHLYRSSKPQDMENSLCFQIFGFDIFLDHLCKPWLIEVNHSPSFLTDSPLDYAIKKNILRDSLHLLNLSQRRKNRYLNQQRTEKEKRLVDNQKVSARQKLQEKEQTRQKKMISKDKFENSNMGDFQNLYPLPKGVSPEQDALQDLYDLIYFKKSRQVYDETLSGGGVAKSKRDLEKQQDQVILPQPTQLSPPKRQAKAENVRTSQVMSQTNYGTPQKQNLKTQREKNYSLAFPLNKIGLNGQDSFADETQAQKHFYEKLNSQIQQTENINRDKMDHLNSTSMNKIKDFLDNTQSYQTTYNTPKITSARENTIDQKYYNQGLNIANIKQKHKWELPPTMVYSPQSNTSKYQISSPKKPSEFDPRLLCLPEQSDIIPRKFLEARTNRDSHSKVENMPHNIRISQQSLNRTQQNFVTYESFDTKSNVNFQQLPFNNHHNKMPQSKNFSSVFTQQTTNGSTLSHLELNKNNNKFIQDAQAFANFISKNQVYGNTLESQNSMSQEEFLSKGKSNQQIVKEYLTQQHSNSLSQRFPLKKQTIAQMQLSKKMERLAPANFSNLNQLKNDIELSQKNALQAQQQQIQHAMILASPQSKRSNPISNNQVLYPMGQIQNQNTFQMFLTIPNQQLHQPQNLNRVNISEQQSLLTAKNIQNQKLKPIAYAQSPIAQISSIKKNKQSSLMLTGNSYMNSPGDQIKIKYNNNQ